MKLILFIEDNDNLILVDKVIDLDKKIKKDKATYLLPSSFSMSEFLRQASIKQLDKKLARRGIF